MTVRGGCSLLKLMTFYLDQRHAVVARALSLPSPLPPVAELLWALCPLQTHQTIVVQLLQSTTRLLECPWLQQQHKGSVEACVRTLAMVGEYRAWPLPGPGWGHQPHSSCLSGRSVLPGVCPAETALLSFC